MALTSKHPQYTRMLPDWLQMRHTHEGERKVKEEGFTYLKPTSGMVDDGALTNVKTSKGWTDYEAYRLRARCPDLVREAVEAMIGVMWRKPPSIEVPEQLANLLDEATPEGETLELLLRRVNEQQLIVGRLGLLGDVIDTGDRAGQTYIALYEAEDLGNWDAGRRDGIEVENLNLVVIDETGPERVQDFEWQDVTKYRVLQLMDGASQAPAGDGPSDPVAGNAGGGGNVSVVNLPEGTGTYAVGVFRDTADYDAGSMRPPKIRGRTTAQIPFTFVNTKDLSARPDIPPLLALSNLVLSIYRSEADYRQALHMIGQDTLVREGAIDDPDEETRVGAGAKIDLPQGGKAYYIGINSQGVPEQRTALENDQARAQGMSGKLLDDVSRSNESGKALHIRVAAKTATLVQIVRTGAAGLERVLKILARWAGGNPDEVRVEPSLDFTDDQVEGRTVVEFTSAKTMGAPFSWETLHEHLQERGFASLTFEEELERIQREREEGIDDLLSGGSGGSTNPDGPEDDQSGQDPQQDPQQDPSQDSPPVAG